VAQHTDDDVGVVDNHDCVCVVQELA
jgi:hypothetical protein